MGLLSERASASASGKQLVLQLVLDNCRERPSIPRACWSNICDLYRKLEQRDFSSFTWTAVTGCSSFAVSRGEWTTSLDRSLFMDMTNFLLGGWRRSFPGVVYGSKGILGNVYTFALNRPRPEMSKISSEKIFGLYRLSRYVRLGPHCLVFGN